MSGFAEVVHQQWIAAKPMLVSAQFADLDHHIDAQVHPKLRFEVLERSARAVRFAQEVCLLGIRQRDVFERRVQADGTIVDCAVEGFNKGGMLIFRFCETNQDGRSGTLVEITIRLPLPPFIGRLLKPLLEAQVRREVTAAALEDRADIEQRGYPRRLSASALAA